MSADSVGDRYRALRLVLDMAFEQAAFGKGKERHAAGGLAFEDQPILQISRMVGYGFASGQAMKKLQEAATILQPKASTLQPEASTLQYGVHDRAQREILGAIVYAAAAWLWVEEQREGSDDPGMLKDLKDQ
jgi:hypothetical protein